MVNNLVYLFLILKKKLIFFIFIKILLTHSFTLILHHQKHIQLKVSLKIVKLKMSTPEKMAEIIEQYNKIFNFNNNKKFMESADAGGHILGLSPQFTDDGEQIYNTTSDHAIQELKKLLQLMPCVKNIFVKMGVWDAEKKTLRQFTLDTFVQLGEKVEQVFKY